MFCLTISPPVKSAKSYMKTSALVNSGRPFSRIFVWHQSKGDAQTRLTRNYQGRFRIKISLQFGAIERKKALHIQAHITTTNVSVLVNIMSDWFWW